MPSHGYYRLRATDTGFELAWVGATMTITIDDEGSHGPLAELYAEVDRIYHASKKEADRQRDAEAELQPRQPRMNIGGQGELYGSH